ncbi:MAG: threonine synthase [Alphaproteobacteria bacterium]|nr:threonine synthase [Alphaproteobacteria bacterium]
MAYVDRIAYWDSGDPYPAGGPAPNTVAPGDFPEVRYDLDRIRETVDRDSIVDGPASLWRYAAVLPVEDPANAVTLGEGWTPLLPLAAMGSALGCPNLLAKDEGRNPSGTFKDRGASVAVTRHRELGVETIAHNSSGNAGGSMALYAARAGIRCVNLLPTDVLPASLAQSVIAGADTRILDGPWQASGGMVADAAADHGWFNIGTLKEPYRLEGKKTMGYEIAEQLGWSLPDAVVYPTGGGLGAIAIYKAFRELQALGWVEAGPLPTLIATQYEGCAPIVRAFDNGADTADLWTDLDVLPGGLKSTRPPGDKAVLKLVRETGGTAVAVSTEESLDATARLGRTEGLFVCPESATTLVGLERALDAGVVARDAHIVLLMTGSGLKSVPVLPLDDAPIVGPKDRL